MNDRPTPLERAFELARSGDYGSIPELRAQLSVEGHSTRVVTGATQTKQLREIITASRPPTKPAATLKGAADGETGKRVRSPQLAAKIAAMSREDRAELEASLDALSIAAKAKRSKAKPTRVASGLLKTAAARKAD